jgi:hypothetical protein
MLPRAKDPPLEHKSPQIIGATGRAELLPKVTSKDAAAMPLWAGLAEEYLLA